MGENRKERDKAFNTKQIREVLQFSKRERKRNQELGRSEVKEEEKRA